ncbi:Arginase/deacetylase [Marasmius fiardii PR-910]|nr:Arginase/deacetylase [Marasmius fiardii PR-910]
MNCDATTDQRPTIAYVVSADLIKWSSLLPSNPKRSLLVHTLVKDLGLLSPSYSDTCRIQIVRPRIATHNDLEVYHSKQYLYFLLGEGDSDSDAFLEDFGLEDDCPLFPGLDGYVRAIAGATLTAANALKVTDVAICWDGGRHHAMKARASGFCYVADCVLAILLLKRLPPVTQAQAQHSTCNEVPSTTRKARVMYLDLDVHFSDGVSQAFYQPTTSFSKTNSNRQVLTLSVHHTSPGFFPVSPLSGLPPTLSEAEKNAAFDPYTLSIPLNRGLSSRTYCAIWPIIEQVRDAFDPDYIVVQCGVDTLAGDPGSSKADSDSVGVGNWSLGGRAGDMGEGSLGWCIHRIFRTWRGKKLLLGGGGYHSPNVARAWAYLTSIALDKPLPLDTRIPISHDGFPLYAPSFTLDVPPGNMEDLNWSKGNKVQELSDARERFEWVCKVLEMDRMQPKV